MLVLEKEKVKVANIRKFLCPVDYTRPVGNLIEDSGYEPGQVSPSILMTGRFPSFCHRELQKEIYLIDFDQVVNTNEVIEAIDKLIFRPAELPELAALGHEFPELQKRGCIIALGSVWHAPKGCMVPGLGCKGDKRIFAPFHFEREWTKGFCFAAVSLLPTKSA